MSEFNGFIEDFANGHIRGWVVTHHKAIAKIYCDDQYITDISKTFLREDVIAAGLTNDNAGFNIDIREQLAGISGEHFSVYVLLITLFQKISLIFLVVDA